MKPILVSAVVILILMLVIQNLRPIETVSQNYQTAQVTFQPVKELSRRVHQDIQINRDVFESPQEFREKVQAQQEVKSVIRSVNRIDGIFLGNNTCAVIDGTVYKIGDNVNNRVISDITREGVFFENGEKLVKE